MKNLTVKRSTLSRESMDMIENLADNETINSGNNLYNEDDNTPGEYYRPEKPSANTEKSKEIDLLWQSFRPSQFNSSSPLMCYVGGILTGIISTVVILFLFGALTSSNFSLKKADNSQKITTAVEAGVVQDAVSEEDYTNKTTSDNSELSDEQNSNSAQEVAAEDMQKYVIKSGDTVESIIKHFYGSYTPERAQAIMKANNLKNLDRISIDQVLLIPLEK